MFLEHIFTTFLGYFYIDVIQPEIQNFKLKFG